MNKSLVIGGSGVLGSAVVHELQKSQINFQIGSRNPIKTDSYSTVNQASVPWTHTNLATGDGLSEALAGVDTVFHLATGQGKIGRESDEVVFTRNLLNAVKQSNVKHLIYSSIVGVDKIPYSYYQAKLNAEKLIQASQVPYTILRATQFHDFVDFVLGKLLNLPIGFVPKKLLIQPIDVVVVAQELCRLAQAGSQQTTLQLGGPKVYDAGTLAKRWMQHRKVSKPIIPIPAIGAIMKPIAAGRATCPEAAIGTKTWKAYLTERYGEF
ncbi:NAD-dependent epimerase/dehydratase family protein [Spirosoma sp. KCTC 42546]|uniref:SDR family oxidoreductase n=1 Tax=Spirosoma sp. KCTC 42546 TaxID=2520506 RepID=UPI001156CC8B|nr:NAD(P)H-binding protein [Spirosoma sp. KCTC 42546]QDK81503.1 NAD-dependent epimerase/dehydratase family protein [Spirosoma sp. KCTC 42546]